ncbi:MAG TPA: isopentenyl phosphate kinase [Thermoanaerobaculia bacterium]|nr:isopentenyl phosphate kinase [Thermoanaerobaculia bacterium]
MLLVKLGGSLLTDKRRPETAHPERIDRLAGELAAGLARGLGGDLSGFRLVLGHGSGSFGHVAARRHRLAAGLAGGAGQLAGVAETQARAAALHRLVLDALARAGVSTFSIAPSSCLVTDGGRPAEMAAEPVALALRRGLLPVVYGDVVTDRSQGVAIASTETVFAALAAALPRHGYRAARALWLGDTAGLLDAAGATVPEIAPEAADAARPLAGGAAATDVTGGMAHRLDAALALAGQGVESRLADGTVPGLFARALAGEAVPGTRITARALC